MVPVFAFPVFKWSLESQKQDLDFDLLFVFSLFGKEQSLKNQKA
jgi:hypothetical protein